MPGKQNDSARDIIRWIDSRLCFFQNDIRNIRASRINAGYPVLALVFSQIEYLSDLMYFQEAKKSKDNRPTQLAGKFINEEMSHVNPIYGITFDKAHNLQWGQAENFGELLYLTLRSKVVHQGGSYPPFEVTAEEPATHLHMKFDAARRLFLVHAYRMNDELQGTIQMLFTRVLDGEDGLLDVLKKGIIRENTRLRQYQRDVSPILDEMEEKDVIL